MDEKKVCPLYQMAAIIALEIKDINKAPNHEGIFVECEKTKCGFYNEIYSRCGIALG